MKKITKQLFLTFIYMYVLNQFVIDIGSISIRGIHINFNSLQLGGIYVVCLFYIILNINQVISLFYSNNRIKYYVNIAIIFLCLSSSLSFILPIIYGTFDFTYFTVIIIGIARMLIKMLFLLILTKKMLRKNNLLFSYMKLFIDAMVLYSIFSLLLNASPEFKSLWFHIIYDPNGSLAQQLYYQTRIGLVGFSGFRQTFYCSMGVIFQCYYLYLISIQKKKGFLLSLGKLILLLCGNSLYGRVGMLYSIIAIVIMLIYLFIKRGKIKLLLIITGVVAVIYSMILIMIQYSETMYNWYTWAMGPINSLIHEGRLGYSAENMIENMYFLPSATTLILGDGIYTEYGHYYMHTDVGLMRAILFYGIIGALAGYLIVFTILKGIYKINKRINRNMILLIILLFFLLVFFELKGEVFYIEIGIIFPLLLASGDETALE